jgi:hypothetical protein
MDDREFSDLKLDRKECERCGALWLNGVHHWRTGCKGNELDLAGLVCNKVNDPQCINPKKGQVGGDTWEKRAEFLGQLTKDIDNYFES